MEEEQWYTNKDLYCMITDLKTELSETRNAIKQYNGLRAEYAKVLVNLTQLTTDVMDMKSKEIGKYAVGKAIREWGGWLIAVLAFVINYLMK